LYLLGDNVALTGSGEVWGLNRAGVKQPSGIALLAISSKTTTRRKTLMQTLSSAEEAGEGVGVWAWQDNK